MFKIDPKYLAGVMDSDGSFSITKRHIKRKSCNYTAMVQLSWTKTTSTEQFMQILKAQYGGSYAECFPSSAKNYKNSRLSLKYCATGRAAQKISEEVKDFLMLKQKQAENILKLRKIIGSAGGKFRALEKTQQLESLYLLNKSLNTKNGNKFNARTTL